MSFKQCLAADNFVVDWRMGLCFVANYRKHSWSGGATNKAHHPVSETCWHTLLRFAEGSFAQEETPYFEAMRELYGSAGLCGFGF